VKSGISVAEAMTTRPVTAESGTSVKECAKLMKRFDVGSVLIKKGDKVLGIVTEHDLARKVIAGGMSYDEPADAVMERVLVTISPDKDLWEAMDVMKRNDVRHLPVVENEKFVGFVTIKDVLKIEPQLFELFVENIKLREEFRKPVAEVTAEEGICESCGNYSEKVYDVDGSKLCKDCASY